MTLAIIHCEKQIPWQPKRAAFFAAGLQKQGIPYRITDSRERQQEGFPILLGTTLWRDIERTGDYLLVDRCSFGDTEKFVQLVWNGHGRRGDHRVPKNYDASRWIKHRIELKTWKASSKRVLCGQAESYCNLSLEDWYKSVKATHFRSHPRSENRTGLPDWRSFDDCELVTLNSSVGVQGFVEGVKTEVHDMGGMAFGHECNDESRLSLMHWLAWTQWSDDEIKEGLPWDYLL